MKRRKLAYAVLFSSLLLLSISSNVIAESSKGVKLESDVNYKNLDSKSIEEILDSPKTDISFISGTYGDKYIEYTYKSEGKEWRAVEKSSSSFKELHSIIYLKNEEENYELFTIMDANNISPFKVELTLTPPNGQVPLNKTIDMTPQQVGTEIINEQTDGKMYTTSNNPSGLPISGWNHYGNYFYNTQISKYTVSFVTNIIVGIVSVSKLSIPGVIRVSSTVNVVGDIVKNQIPDIWYTDKVYYKTVVPPDPNMFRMKVAEKTIHTFYSDSGRARQLEGSPITSEVWLDGYQE